MIRKGLLYTIMAGSLLWASCDGDLGNYDYHKLSTPVVTGIDKQISVDKFTSLHLSPTVEGEGFTDERCNFEWKVVPEEDGEPTVIGNERVLNIKEMTLPEGRYNLYFTVTDRESGVFWQHTYELRVTQTTSEGWMVLCADNENNVRLDMVSTITGNTLRNVLATSGIPAWKGPRRIQQLTEYSEQGSPFYLLTNDGATRLSNDGFAWKDEYLIKYEMANGQEAKPYEIVTTARGKMMVAGANFHYSDCFSTMEIGLFGFPLNTDFEVEPMIGSNMATTMIVAPLVMMYDKTNKRFMGYGRNLASSDFKFQNPLQEMNDMAALMEELKKGVTGKAFDEFPKGLDYVYMENTCYDPGNGQMGVTYTILADGDKRYLYGIQLGDMLPQSWSPCKAALGKTHYGDLSNCPNITEVTDLFAFSSIKNYMYYAVGGTLYRIDLSKETLQAEKQFTLPEGETITRLKFNIFRKAANKKRSYDLVVGSLKGEEGILRIYPDAETMEGDFSKVQPEVYDGFARIVDVTYREW